eukprot:Em0040g7a
MSGTSWKSPTYSTVLLNFLSVVIHQAYTARQSTVCSLVYCTHTNRYSSALDTHNHSSDQCAEDAQVICCQLGFSGTSVAFSNAYFGAGSSNQPIWLDDVNCLGTETNVGQLPEWRMGYPQLRAHGRCWSEVFCLGQHPGLVCRSLSGWPTPPLGACLPESPPNDLTSHAWLGHGDSQLVTSVTHGSSPQPTGRGWQNHSSEGFSPWAPNQSTGHVLTEAYSWGA